MFKLCIAGDIILMEALPEEYAPIGKSLMDYVNGADIRIANMETTISNYDAFASTYCGGTWLAATPSILDALDCFGFQYYSFANNHSMDYSYGGLKSTMKVFGEHGVEFGGTGMNLEEATRHRLLRSCNGNAAVISVCSTCNDAARAGDPCRTIPGRPGISMLRYKEIFAVNKVHMEHLKEIAKATFINGRINNSKKGGYTVDEPDIFNLGALRFTQNEIEGKRSIPNPNDCKRIEAAIKKAKEETENVIIYLHTHEIKGRTDDEPDYFTEEFSRRCADAGASAIVCSGTHQMKAVEVYRGVPIFYSIANFIFQSDHVGELPLDFYEKYNVDPVRGAKKGLAVRSANGARGLQFDVNNYLALVPTLYFDGGKVAKAVIQPIELCFDSQYSLKGLPRKAEGADFERIFERLKTLCMPYNTTLSAAVGMIVIEI